MFCNMRENLRIDLSIPALQTATVYLTNELLGSLGQHAVRSQTAVLVGGVTSMVATLASNFFNKAYVYYVSLPFGLIAGLGAHRFFYPAVPTQAVLDLKGALALIGVLAAVKLVVENLARVQQNEKKEDVEIEKEDDTLVDETQKE